MPTPKSIANISSASFIVSASLGNSRFPLARNRGSTVPHTPAGPFWAVLNRLLILVQVIFLILSEIGWPNALFTRFLPFLNDEHGVAAIGVLECLIGAQVNSHAVADFPMVAAFLLFSIGCLNLISVRILCITQSSSGLTTF